MEVLGISPIQRLVVPRVLAAMLVAVLLNGLVRSSASSVATSSTSSSRAARRARTSPSFTALAQLPDLWTGEIKALIFGVHRRGRRGLQGPERRRRPQGRGRRREPERGHHLHAAVRRQLRHHAPCTSKSSRRRSEGGADDEQGPATLAGQPRRGARQPRRADASSTCARSPGAPRTLRRYKKEVVRLLAEVSLGSGALAVIGGTVGVIAFLAFFTGTEVGLQGYSSLNQLGTGAFTGFVSAYLNTREIAPLVAGAGARRHRRLRLHRPARRHAHLRGGRRPRGHGHPVAAVPRDHPDDRGLHRRHPALRPRACSRPTPPPGSSSTRTSGSRGHLRPLLPPVPAADDVFFSFLKVMVFAVVIILIHCYYGYNASRWPGRRRRRRRQGGAHLDRRHQHRRLLPSLAIWGATTTVRIAGYHRADRCRHASAATPGPITHRRWAKAYGIVFLLVLALLLGLAIASFQKRFTPVVMVTLETDRIGQPAAGGSDVKLRGLIVGEVRHIEATATGARLELALQPDEVAQDPGERHRPAAAQDALRRAYVDLVTPAQPGAGRSEAGDVIPQDRSRVAIELETVFDNLYPLLRTVAAGEARDHPQRAGDDAGRPGRPDRATTSCSSTATSRRSTPACRRSGKTSAGSPTSPTSTPARRRTASASRESLGSPTRRSSRRTTQLAAFLVGTAGFANDARGFLRRQRAAHHPGRAGEPADPAAAREVLARATRAWPRASSTGSRASTRPSAAGTFHITLEVVPPRQAVPAGGGAALGRQARAPLLRPADTGRLPGQPLRRQPLRRRHAAREHRRSPSPPCRRRCSATPPPRTPAAPAPPMSSASSARCSPATAGPPTGASGIQTLLAGPMMRGTVVSTR